MSDKSIQFHVVLWAGSSLVLVEAILIVLTMLCVPNNISE